MVKGNGSNLNPSKDVQHKIARLERMVARTKPEVKYADLTQTMTNVPVSTGSVGALTLVAQGVTVAGRIGNFIRVHHIEYHASITGYVTSVTIDSAYRVYIVQDTTQVGDTAPALADLVDQPSQPIVQLRNVNQMRRFRVLYDSGPQLIGVPGAVGSLTTSEAKFQIHVRKDNLNIEVAYNGVASTDIQKNGIYVMVSTNVSNSGDILDLSATSRIGFTDV